MTPRSILVFSLKYLGDVIVATPALRALRDTWPAARITVMLRHGYEDALAGGRLADGVLAVKPVMGARDILGAIAAVRRIRPDLAIALEPGDKESVIAYFSGARVRVAPDFQPLARFWTVRVPIREKSCDYRKYYLAIAAAAGANSRSDTTEMTLTPDATAWASDFLRLANMGRGPILGIHPGARESNRRWPAERFAAVIDALVPRIFGTAVVMGGPGEETLVDAVLAATHAPAIARAATLGIQQTGALMARCRLCLTLDSAPRHIAAAVGTRTVSLLPDTHRVTWRIYDERDHRAIFGAPGDPMLVGAVGVDEVVAAAISLAPKR